MLTGTIIPTPSMSERIRIIKKHLDFSVHWKGPRRGIYEMRRHYTNYFKGIPHFKSYRKRLVEAPEYENVKDILDEISQVFENQPVELN